MRAGINNKLLRLEKLKKVFNLKKQYIYFGFKWI